MMMMTVVISVFLERRPNLPLGKKVKGSWGLLWFMYGWHDGEICHYS